MGLVTTVAGAAAAAAGVAVAEAAAAAGAAFIGAAGAIGATAGGEVGKLGAGAGCPPGRRSSSMIQLNLSISISVCSGESAISVPRRRTPFAPAYINPISTFALESSVHTPRFALPDIGSKRQDLKI